MRKFSEKDLKQIKAAVKKAEKTTSGEIVPLVAPAADEYWPGIIFFSLVTVAVFTVLYMHQELWLSARYLVLGQILTLLASLAIVGLFPRVKLLFIPPKTVAHTTRRRALQEYCEHRISNTQKHTGILLALFLLEKRVEVVADEGINRKCKQATWDEVVKIIVTEARQGQVADGLQKGILRCGEILTKHFPAGKINKNELNNDLIVEK
jgi:putative membrane protein